MRISYIAVMEAFTYSALFLILLKGVTSQSLTISSCNATSQNAADMCDLASPGIRFWGRTDVLSLDIVPPLIDEPLWIGYVEKYTMFEYIGCVHKNYVTPSQYVEIYSDPGRCRSFCPTQLVGLRRNGWTTSKQRCYCVERYQNVLRRWCARRCRDPWQDFLCGASDYVSIYKQVDYTVSTETPVSPIKQQCLAYNSSGGGRYFWSHCGSTYPVLCTHDVSPSYQNKTWADSMRLCLENNKLPVYPRTYLSGIEPQEMTIWMGVIRSYTIFTTTEDDTSSEDIAQGHTTQEYDYLGHPYLRFEANGNRLHALCDGESECKTTTTHSSTTTTTPTETTTTHSESEAGKQKESGGQNLVAVFVVIPIVLLVAALVIAYLFWRKRRTSRKNREAADYIDPGKGKTSTRNAMSNAAYQDDAIIKPQTKDGLQHDYLELEAQNEYADINASEQQDTTGEEYDTTESALAKHADTDNVYNRLGNRSDDTYNHVNQHGRHEDDTYNHTNQHDPREDETYNHIGTGDADATYGAVSAQSNSKRRQQETDNDYNELNIGDDTYNQPGGTLPRTGHNTNADDAYDHVNNDSRDQVQTPDSYTYSAPIPKRRPPTPENENEKYDYAYAKAGPTGGSNAPAKFGVGHLPNAGSYELAKAPMETANYELAKPPGV